MAIIIQHPGSSGGYAMNAMSQISSGYMAGKKAQAEAKELATKTQYYEALSKKAEADALKTQLQTALTSGAIDTQKRITTRYADRRTPGGQADRAPMPQGYDVAQTAGLYLDEFGREIDPMAGPTEDGSGFAALYYSKQFSDVRKYMLEGLNAPGALDDPNVRAAMMNRASLNEAREHAANVSHPNAAAFKAAYQTELESWTNAVDTELARANERAYQNARFEFQGIMGKEDKELDASYTEHLENILHPSITSGQISHAEAYYKVKKLYDDYSEVAIARSMGQRINAQVDGMFKSKEGEDANAEFIRIKEALVAGFEGSSTPDADAAALITRLKQSSWDDHMDAPGAKKWLRELGEDYEDLQIAAQGKQNQWVPYRKVLARFEASAEQWERQKESEFALDEQIRAGNPKAEGYLQRVIDLYYSADVSGLEEGSGPEHDARLVYVESEMNALMGEEGKQGLSHSGYARLVTAGQIKGLVSKEKREEAARIEEKRLHPDAPTGLAHDPSAIVPPFSTDAPTAAIDSRVERAVSRHLKLKGTSRTGDRPHQMITERVTRRRLNDFELEFKAWFNETGQWQLEGYEGKHGNRMIGGKRVTGGMTLFKGMNEDEALHYAMAAMDKRNPNWIYGGGVYDSTRFLREGKKYTGGAKGGPENWFYDSYSRGDKGWLSLAREAGKLASSGRESGKFQAESGFEPQFIDPDEGSSAKQRARVSQVKTGKGADPAATEPAPERPKPGTQESKLHTAFETATSVLAEGAPPPFTANEVWPLIAGEWEPLAQFLRERIPAMPSEVAKDIALRIQSRDSWTALKEAFRWTLSPEARKEAEPTQEKRRSASRPRRY